MLTKLFADLSSSDWHDLSQAKAAMSTRYLEGQRAVAGRGRAFRAAVSAVDTHNVVGVGIDEKFVGGSPTGVSVVKFLVRSKVPLSGLATRELLPTTVDGIATDVEEVGLIVPQAKAKRQRTALVQAMMPNPRARMRPLQPGASIGFREPTNAFVTAGTFGLLVKNGKGEPLVLSNNHVLAFENGVDAKGNRRDALPFGAPIYQPGLMDHCKVPGDQIGELFGWVDLRANRSDNEVDAALAKPKKKADLSRDILFIGPPGKAAAAKKDMVVHKFGRTTSYTAGRISSVLFDVTVPYEIGAVTFVNQIAIRGLDGSRFSDSGDSGSAILDRATNRVVGLLFAGATNGSLTFANHIGTVLKALRVRLA